MYRVDWLVLDLNFSHLQGEGELMLDGWRHTFLLETLIGLLAAAVALLTAAAADSALLMITALC